MTSTSNQSESGDALENMAEQINPHIGGFNRTMGLRFTLATADEVEAELEVGDQHRQPYGLVHGGVYAGMIETLCSTGAALYSLSRNQTAVGLENNTSFLRAVREGRLRCRAEPLARGRRSQVWEARITDDQDRLVASGRVRLLCLEAGAEAAGEVVRLDEDLEGPAPKRP